MLAHDAARRYLTLSDMRWYTSFLGHLKTTRTSCCEYFWFCWGLWSFVTGASRELLRYEWRVIIETKTGFVEPVSNIWSGSLLIRSIISCLFRTHQPTIHTHRLLLFSYDCVSFDKRGLTHGFDDIGTHLSVRCRHLIRKNFV